MILLKYAFTGISLRTATEETVKQFRQLTDALQISREPEFHTGHPDAVGLDGA